MVVSKYPLGAREASLHVSPTNQRAMNFYLKNGWVNQGARLDDNKVITMTLPDLPNLKIPENIKIEEFY